MIVRRTAKRLQNILLSRLKNKEVLRFFSGRRSFLLTDNTVAHKHSFLKIVR